MATMLNSPSKKPQLSKALEPNGSSDLSQNPRMANDRWRVTARGPLVVRLLLVYAIIIVMGVIPLDYVHPKPATKQNLIASFLKWLILEGPSVIIHGLFFVPPHAKANEPAVDYVKRAAKRNAMGYTFYLFHSLLSSYVYFMWYKIGCVVFQELWRR